jgi:hypothetical protein
MQFGEVARGLIEDNERPPDWAASLYLSALAGYFLAPAFAPLSFFGFFFSFFFGLLSPMADLLPCYVRACDCIIQRSGPRC